MTRAALTDSFHLHTRNFPSLFEYFAANGIEPSILLDSGSEGYGLITCTGDYSDVRAQVSPIMAGAFEAKTRDFEAMSRDELYCATAYHLRLWPLCRSELLAYLLTLDNWQEEVRRRDDRATFDKAHQENRDDLTRNMAAAAIWLDYWHYRREAIFKNHFCCVFSGSMTYARTLLEMLRRSRTRAFLVESVFTGNEYLFDEMYLPSANNALVGSETVRASRRMPHLEAADQYDREVVKAHNKLLIANNKNVKQPPPENLPSFGNAQDQILIVGQVANDFSLIEDGFPYVGSIPVYIALIRRLLDQTDCNIVFKAHPWENQKVHLRTPKTFDALAAFAATLPDADRARLLLVEDVNLNALIEQSRHVVTLCSQAGIEAAYHGLRPVVLGRAFYSGAGFTTDCADIAAAVTAVSQEPGQLDLRGYKALNRFLVDFLVYGTVSVHNSGGTQIARRLETVRPLVREKANRPELTLAGGAPSARSNPDRWTGVLRKKRGVADKENLSTLATALDFDLPDLPDAFPAGAGDLSLSLQLNNHSEFILPHKVSNIECRLSYHIFDAEGRRYVWNGLQTPVDVDIRHALRRSMRFGVPEAAGHYKIVPALLYPGLLWIESARGWEFRVE